MTYVADQREAFDRLITEEWHTYHGKEWAYARRLEIAALFKIIQPRRILDIGCGCGFHDLEMAKRSFVERVDARDYSSKSIERAQMEYPHPKVNYAAADLWDLPEDRSYDLAISFQVFEHLREQDDYLLKCRKLVKPGGAIAIVQPNWHSLNNQMRFARGLPRQFVDPLHITECSLGEMRVMIQRHGLAVIGEFGHSLYSEFWPAFNRLPYQVRVELGRFWPERARVIATVARVPQTAA